MDRQLRTRRVAGPGRVSAVLAVLLVLVLASAGLLSAREWRSSITEQADRAFERQVQAVEDELRVHFAALDSLFATAADAARNGTRLAPALSAQDTIKQYPGIVAVGHLTGSPTGELVYDDDYSTVGALGIIDLRLQSMIRPELRNTVARATRTGKRTASPVFGIRWFTANQEPVFFVVQPIAGSPGTWSVLLVYGNWVVQDSLQAANSSFRAQIMEGQQIVARDYLPIGSSATRPPPPIPDSAIQTSRPLPDFDRPWQLVVADTTGVTAAQIGGQPTLLAVGLALIGLFSGLLVWVLGRSRASALRMVDAATTELRASEARLRHQAFTDDLTGLANRAMFGERLRRAAGSGDAVAVLLCDLDDFKTVNDDLGHAAGDELLVEVADRLRHCARETDTVARLGGDEFAFLVESSDSASAAQEIADRLLDALQQPVRVGDRDLLVGCSIGIATGGGGASEDDADALLRTADVAMYAAKRTGKGRSAFYEPTMQRDVGHPAATPPPQARPAETQGVAAGR